MEWLPEWNLWNAGSLKLEVSGSLTIRVWTDKGGERAAYSTTGPLAFCGFIKRNDNHNSDFFPAWLICPWAALSSLFPPLFESASVENEGQVISAWPNLSTSHSDEKPKHLQYPLSEITFFLVTLCQWEFFLKNLIWGTTECRPFPE